MLITAHSLLRRHRRIVLGVTLGCTLALAGMTAHSMLMDPSMPSHMAGDAAVICLAVGGTLMLGAAAFMVKRSYGPGANWPLVRFVVPEPVLVPANALVFSRAGPPSALLQVFRF